jgi:hypothetical protein
MTEERLNELVGIWACRLGLDSWRIAVIFDDQISIGDRRVFARCERSEFFDRATIRIDRCALEDSAERLGDTIERDHVNTDTMGWDEYIEITIVHELLHMSLRNLVETGDLVRDDITPQTKHVWDAAWRRAEEEVCERMAVALVESFGEES